MISSVKSCFFTVFSGLVKSFGSLEVYCFVNGFRLCKILRGLLIHCCCSGRGCEYLVVFWQICKKELNNLFIYYMHKKGVKFACVEELAKLNFTYITLHTKIDKAGSWFDDSVAYLARVLWVL